MHPHHYDKHAGSAKSKSPEPATTTRTVDAPPVSSEDIRLCAYRKWESAGKPTGDGLQFWLAAEQELAQGK